MSLADRKQRLVPALFVLLLSGVLMATGHSHASSEESSPTGSQAPDWDVRFQDDAVNLKVRLRQERVEKSEGAQLEAGGPEGDASRSQPRGSGRADEVDGTGLARPPQLLDRNFCTNSGASDPSCWDLLPRDCPVGFLIGGLAAGGPAECPSTDEEPVELAVAPPAPDQTEAAEEIPAHELVYTTVVDEFSRLPIDGGRVAFEEQLQGFGYINRHTNVFADVETQTLTEELLGHTVQIRAIPVEYTFDYGDGTVRTTSRAGESVAHFAETNNSINLTDAETPTSHIYSSTGVYPVQVTTRFIGEFQVEDSGWIAIPGSTTAAASPGEADIWRTSQRLVSGACRDAADYGCNGPFTIEPGDRPPAIYQDRYDEDGNWLGR